MKPVSISFGQSKIVRRALKLGAIEAEVLCFNTADSVTRFSKNIISESLAHNNSGAYIRILTSPGQYAEQFIAQGELFKDAKESNVDSLLEHLVHIAKISDRKEWIQSFNSKRRSETLAGVYSKKTASISDKERAELAGDVIDKSLDYNGKIKQVAGTITTRLGWKSLVNSNGLNLFHKYTGISFLVTPLAEENGSVGIGFASRSSHDLRDINFEEITNEAAKDSVDSLHPKKIDLGRYDVIFAPDSAGDVLGTFVQLGFWVGSAPTYVNLGNKCASKSLTVTDDPKNKETLMACPFDAEGSPTKRLTLINKGVALNRCLDRKASFFSNTKSPRKRGQNFKKSSTGHSMFLHDGTYNTKFFSGWSYYPQNQIVTPGSSSVEELIKESKKAILVKRLMYAGLPMGISKMDTIQAFSMGTWLVENGEIICSLPSVRISHSLSGIVNSIEMMGSRKTVKKLGSINMPWMKCLGVTIEETASLAIPEGVY